MNPTTTTSGLRVSTSVRLAETQDGAVLLDVKQGLCFSINPVGTLIWKHVMDGRARAQIIEDLAKTFGISAEQARDDTEEFLGVLVKKGLLRRNDSNDTAKGQHGWFAETFPRLLRLVGANRTRQLE